MSLARARDTGTPKRANCSAGARICSQRRTPEVACRAYRPRGIPGAKPPPGSGAGRKANACTDLSLGRRLRQTPPPIHPARLGKVTVKVAAIATAASAAVPPALKVSSPTSTARGSSAETKPAKPAT